MSRKFQRELTEEQKEMLRQNPNIERVGKVSVFYKKEFIKKALEQNYKGMSAEEIFTDAGIDIEVIGKGIAQNILGNWRFQDKYKKSASAKYLEGQTKKNKAIKELLEENTYLKAENEFLKKLKALEGLHR